jgi:hypothetical protein
MGWGLMGFVLNSTENEVEFLCGKSSILSEDEKNIKIYLILMIWMLESWE